ncbi:helix-turn-helix domain-containing protein [Nocardia elegans]|uniref:PucR family transcriptional regulator n=1 Tax=Nocardia elegans TaxID=300029 RepID=A0ABW6THP4_9NOCA|nr:helix-turn-helix domain-containing protein [Nocardia elegans]MBF6447278.1 helix-turn-helix domain-containing protein [Nocardia elegans]
MGVEIAAAPSSVEQLPVEWAEPDGERTARAPSPHLPPAAPADEITGLCHEVLRELSSGGRCSSAAARLAEAADRWARRKSSLETVHHTVFETFRLHLESLRTSGDNLDTIMTSVGRVLDALEIVTTGVADAYSATVPDAPEDYRPSSDAVTSALLGGRSAAAAARECGVELAEHYYVLAISLQAESAGHSPAADVSVQARLALRRARAVLERMGNGAVLFQLSPSGGTVLLPYPFVGSDRCLDHVVHTLSAATRTPITATAVHAARAAVPAAATQAHELLDTVHALRCRPGLYRMRDLALEYQLTRPGPALEILGTLLDPLDDHPELTETLVRHCGNELNRQRTAHEMRVHTNTVDYRLKRIGRLIGVDPTSPSGLLQVRAALVARAYRAHIPAR